MAKTKENRRDNKVGNASDGSQDKKEEGVVGVKVTTVLRLAKCSQSYAHICVLCWADNVSCLLFFRANLKVLQAILMPNKSYKHCEKYVYVLSR